MQYKNVKVYREFCDLLKVDLSTINRIQDIPFLPIQFFKSHTVVSSEEKEDIIFTSSGTTGSFVSKHYVQDLSVYETSFMNGFDSFYGNGKDYVILALLPSYLERKGSSLVYMTDYLIRNSDHPESGFYLNNLEDLAQQLKLLDGKKKVLLIGVSFALLDFIESYQFDLKTTTIMETGGMKGKRKELIRSELHALLKKGFGVDTIHSEYGMTELLSQAYSKGNGIFNTPEWMKVLIRDPEDPLTLLQGKTGGINIIDLANYNSCAFIATQDLGRVRDNGHIEIIGRFDHSDIRGCNLMVM